MASDPDAADGSTMGPSTARRRFRDSFSVRRRLVLLGLWCVVFAGASSWFTIHALDESRQASDRAADLAAIQLAHQDAVTQLRVMQAAATEAVAIDQVGLSLSPADLAGEIEGAAEAFILAREDLRSLDPDFSLGLPLADGDDIQARFVEDALRIGALAAIDPATARAELDAFLVSAGPLFATMQDTTAAIDEQATTALEAADRADASATRSIMLTASIGTILIIAVTALAAYSISRQLRQLSTIARAMAAGDLRVRNEIRSADALGDLARSFDEMADSFEDLVDRLEREADRDAFRRRLFDAFEMASDEQDVHTTVAEAMALIADDPMEMLVSDSSKHHVTRAVTHPDAGAPGCPVPSTGQCVAVRRGHRLVFESSRAIDACPHLKRRDHDCAAVCVPVTFNGKAMGVLHATGEDGEKPDAAVVDRLAALASQTGARLGTINAFQGAREQASVDGLTGLKNRRTLENEVRALAAAETDYALVMCDLDHFKNLNDHYGHEMGDRALRLFGRVLRETCRKGDIAARLGGEEFVVVQPRMTAAEAVATVERIQLTLAARLEVGDGPSFTSSFGIADTTMAEGFDGALRVADAGLLAAKDHGRDRWVIGDPTMATELAGRGRPRGSAGDLLETEHGPTELPDRV